MNRFTDDSLSLSDGSRFTDDSPGWTVTLPNGEEPLELAWSEAAREAAEESRKLKHVGYLDPPDHLAREGDRRAGGLTAIGITNTKFGDAVEHSLQHHYGVEDAHPGKRQGPFDIKDGKDVYEVKAVTRHALSYKAAPKKSEVEGKLAHAAAHGLNPHTMIVVHDTRANQMHVYSKPGVGYYRLPLQGGASNGWRYHGSVPLDLAAGAEMAEMLELAWSAQARAKSIEVRRAKRKYHVDLKDLVSHYDPATATPDDAIHIGHHVLQATYAKIRPHFHKEYNARLTWRAAIDNRNEQENNLVHMRLRSDSDQRLLRVGFLTEKDGKLYYHQKPISAATEQQYRIYKAAQELMIHSAADYKKLREARITAMQNALRETLGEIRPMGGKFQRPKEDVLETDPATGKRYLVESRLVKQRPEVERKFGMVERDLPKEWVERSNKAGSFGGEVHRKGSIEGRGHYSHGIVTVPTSDAWREEQIGRGQVPTTHLFAVGSGVVHMEGPSWREKEGTTIVRHEVSHRMEHVVPHLQRLENAYWRERTNSGENFGQLKEHTGSTAYNDHEMASPDDFVVPYAGKTYERNPVVHDRDFPVIDTTHRGNMSGELFTVGQQGLWDDAYNMHEADPEHVKFVAGLNALM